MWDQRLDATIYTFNTSDEKVLSAARDAIRKGITDNELLEMINTDSTSILSTDRRKFSRGDNAFIDEIEWKPGFSTETKTGEKTTMIFVHQVLSPEPKKLNEARGIVTADYQNFLEQEWIRELRAKYPYEVNHEVLSSIK